MSTKKSAANLTISIVNFNGGEYLDKCLASIKKFYGGAIVYVVDNASTDDSLKSIKSKHSWVNIIENEDNLGFGKAHNQVLRILKTEYVLILNPDTEIKKDTIQIMLQFMDDNPDVGAATCKILLPDGSFDWASHRGFPTPVASLRYFLGDDSLYHLSNRDFNKVHEVDAISGSFFMTRKDVLEKVGPPPGPASSGAGGFDEDYFMYAEDIDLCYRIKQKGYIIMFVPQVSIVHHKGVSSGLKKHSQDITSATLQTKQRALNAFYETMKIFYKKHYEKKYPFFINGLIYLGIYLKWFLAKRKLTV